MQEQAAEFGTTGAFEASFFSLQQLSVALQLALPLVETVQSALFAPWVLPKINHLLFKKTLVHFH